MWLLLAGESLPRRLPSHPEGRTDHRPRGTEFPRPLHVPTEIFFHLCAGRGHARKARENAIKVKVLFPRRHPRWHRGWTNDDLGAEVHALTADTDPRPGHDSRYLAIRFQTERARDHSVVFGEYHEHFPSFLVIVCQAQPYTVREYLTDCDSSFDIKWPPTSTHHCRQSALVGRSTTCKNSLKHRCGDVPDGLVHGRLFILNSTRGRSPRRSGGRPDRGPCPRPRQWSLAREVQTYRTPDSAAQPSLALPAGRGDEPGAPVAQRESRQPSLGGDRTAQRIPARALVSFGRELQRGRRLQRQRRQRRRSGTERGEGRVAEAGATHPSVGRQQEPHAHH